MSAKIFRLGFAVILGCLICSSGRSQRTPPTYTITVSPSYVKSWDALVPEQDKDLIQNRSSQEVGQTTQYVDGLGRPLQTVNWQNSPGKTDLVTPVIYDGYGREEYRYLPYGASSNDGSFKSNPFNDQANFYKNSYVNEQPAFKGELFYYSHIQYEASPLDRVNKTFAPGNSWAGSEGNTQEHAVTTQYLVNNSNDLVAIWNITNDPLTYINNDVSKNIPASPGTYNAGTLYKTVTTDEAGHAVVEFKDSEGHVVLKKVQVGNSIPSDYSGQGANWLCTYYVYDVFGHLRFVIPPKASAQLSTVSYALTTDMINELCFRYEYDGRNRLIGKKVPGAAWVYMVYDQRDRLVFAQDGNMRGKTHWLATLYDGLNRPIETAMMTSYGGTRDDLQNYVKNQPDGSNVVTVNGIQAINGIQADLSFSSRQAGRSSYESSNSVTFMDGFASEDGAEFVAGIISANPGPSFTSTLTVNINPTPPSSTLVPLTLTFYDNYNNTSKKFNNLNSGKLDQGSNTYADPVPGGASTMTKAMVTSSKVRVLENANDLTEGGWLESVYYYDDKGRKLQTQSDNYKGGVETITARFDFNGKAVSSYEVHENPAAGTGIRVKTNMNYDHAGRLLSINKQLNDDLTTLRTIVRNEYDALGQLKHKQIGQQLQAGNPSPLVTPLEDDILAYNIRGWLKGINWNYNGINPTTPGVAIGNNKWFSMDLSYDWGFANNQYNGNIAGMRWAAGGDQAERAYTYSYDNVNRLLRADFNQNFGGSGNANWSTTDPGGSGFNINFSIKMGDGNDYTTAYDENGNIRQMQQYGLNLNSSSLIDNLSYTYQTNSNKLLAVTDAISSDNKLGDFIDKNTSGNDYGYDVNGNLISDLNKRINGSTGIDQTSGGGIVYSHLNLPWQISMREDGGNAKGTITYIYDAAGNKIEKRVYENAKGTTVTTTYIGSYVYQDNSLQFLGHEEGRIRKIVPTAYNNNRNYAYDYFLKDHLGNIRTVLTDELEQNTYPAATLEDGAVTTEQVYYTINTGAITGNPPSLSASYPNNNGNPPYNPNPSSNTGATSQKMYRLNGQTGDKTGLGIALKVMAGDNVSVFGKSFWHSNGGSPNNNNFNAAVNDLLTAFASSGAIVNSGHPVITAGALTSAPAITSGLTNWITNNEPVPGSKPKAYINWILFDNQFRPVTTGGNSGFDAVNDNPDQLKSHLFNVAVGKSGYLYVYCSNESDIDVYFDNLQVVHTRGPLTEETHYYPFGLTMAGISDKALKGNYAENKIRFQKQELQNKEFSDGSGLEMYEFKYRMDDPQTGRFWQIDPLSNKYVYNSTYAFSEDKVTSHVELEGLEATPVPAFWGAVKNELHSLARTIDNSVSVGSQTTVEKSPAPAGVVSGSSTFTSTTTVSTNFDEYLGYIMNNNSNNGNPAPLIKMSTTNEYNVGVKVEGNTPMGSASISQSVNQDGRGTTTVSGTFDTKRGINPSVTVSQSTDGTKQAAVGISTPPLGSTTGNVTATGTRNPDGTHSLQVSAALEYKADKDRISFAIYFQLGK